MPSIPDWYHTATWRPFCRQLGCDRTHGRTSENFQSRIRYRWARSLSHLSIIRTIRTASQTHTALLTTQWWKRDSIGRRLSSGSAKMKLQVRIYSWRWFQKDFLTKEFTLVLLESKLLFSLCWAKAIKTSESN